MKITQTFLVAFAWLSLSIFSTSALAEKVKTDNSGAWADIKSGFRKIVRGSAKGVKKVAKKVEDKMDQKEKEKGTP